MAFSARRMIATLIESGGIQPDKLASLLHGRLLPKLALIEKSLSTSLSERQRFFAHADSCPYVVVGIKNRANR